MHSIVVKQCTGFKSVYYNIEFQPRTPSLGRKLVESGHVLNVVEYDKCIEAKVLSQTAGQNLYDTKLWVNDTRQIIKVSCTCTYRESLRCKHVYALIYYVNNDQSITKTSKSREWGTPSARQFALEKYSKGRSCEEMFPHRKRPYNSEGSHEIVKEPLPIDMSEFSKNTAVSIILTACFKDKFELAAEATISFILDKVEEMLSLDQSEKVITPIIRKMSLLVDQNEVYSSSFVIEKNLNDFYDKYIVKSDTEIVELCAKTVKQSKCKKWFDERKLRLTASSNIHSIKTRIRKSIESLVQDILNPKKIDTESAKYGIKNEPKARKLYEKIYDCKVEEVGIICSKKHPWLGVSLDGVVIKKIL